MNLSEIFDQFFPAEISKLVASYLTLFEWKLHNSSATDPLEKCMGPALQIVSMRQLTMEDVNKMDKKIREVLYLYVGDYDDELLQSEDFVVAKVRFYAHTDDLLVYHGFSGDSPGGVLCTSQQSGKNKIRIITELHESLSKPWKKCPAEFYEMAKAFIRWYNHDGGNYDFFILANKDKYSSK